MNNENPDDNRHAEQTYQSLIDISIQALKLGALLNGGALVSLLAFLGSMKSTGDGPPDFSDSAVCFVWGLVSIGAATVCAYITQLILYNEDVKRPWKIGTVFLSHSIFLWFGIVFVTASFAFFGTGALKGVDALGGIDELKPSSTRPASEPMDPANKSRDDVRI